MGKLSRDKRDIFYRKAKESGYRARSAYKLLQLDAEFNLFGDEQQNETVDNNNVDVSSSSNSNSNAKKSNSTNNRKSLVVHRAVDLCAAPGGWSQVLAERMMNNRNSNNTSSLDTADDSDCNETSAAASTTLKNNHHAIVAVDLWPIEPLPGVHFIRGDITSLDTATAIIESFHGKRAEVCIHRILSCYLRIFCTHHIII